jgi:hypothetical protein
MGWHARLRCGAAWVAVALLSPLALAQPPDAAPPAAEITAESLPELTAAPTETATRRPTRLPTATASNTTTDAVTETATPGRPTATPPPTTTRTAVPPLTASPTAIAGALARAMLGDWKTTGTPLVIGALLAIVAMWLGARLSTAGQRRDRRRARRTLATAMLLELRRLDAVLRRVVSLDNPASFPSLDHPIIEAALRDLTLFRTDTSARVAQFHGALRGIQQEIADYRDNPLRWAGRLAELNHLIKGRAAAACRAVPALGKALEREGATPPPHLGDPPSSTPADSPDLPPSPFGRHEGDDWTL